MSLSEYSSLTPNELLVLAMARAMHQPSLEGAPRSGGFTIDGSLNESEMRACARRLAVRGYGECFIHDKGPEVFRINSEGLRAHKEAVGK
ncbi:MAG TPA: hypothetical protein VM915_15295 [Verrucomicrobiae bacterium]|jgi:hypothetical protein|nr:hypothetical protein [Verrucomicrobiae bacterium]